MAVFNKWAKLAVLNLAIVSCAGVLLRYKIAFSLPLIDQRNLLYGHSHFAFCGWVSLALFTGIVGVISENGSFNVVKYQRLFWLAYISSFGMLLTFPFMGYKAPSIAFSTLSIIFSYILLGVAWKDINRSNISNIVRNWFKAGLFFYALSSLGAFHLAWLMATHSVTQEWYIGSVYFFLHFQYNGWFLFGILGLFFYWLEKNKIQGIDFLRRPIFLSLFISCFPGFILSALWMRLPQWLYWLGLTAALLQLVGILLFISFLSFSWKQIKESTGALSRWLWVFSSIALCIKFILQSLSVFPRLSYLAFGYRPIVIGYLHLVLLGFVTFFLLGYLIRQGYLLNLSYWPRRALFLFVGGVIINELLLMIQGLAAINNISVPYFNYYLLGAAVIMCTGLTYFAISQFRIPPKEDQN